MANKLFRIRRCSKFLYWKARTLKTALSIGKYLYQIISQWQTNVEIHLFVTTHLFNNMAKSNYFIHWTATANCLVKKNFTAKYIIQYLGHSKLFCSKIQLRQTVLVVNAATKTLRFGVANLDRRKYIKTFSITGVYLLLKQLITSLFLTTNVWDWKRSFHMFLLCLSCAAVGTQTPHR